MADWKTELRRFLRAQEPGMHGADDGLEELEDRKPEIEVFYASVVMPALEAVKQELESYGRTVSLSREPVAARLVVQHKGVQQLDYAVKVRRIPEGVFAYPEIQIRGSADSPPHGAWGHFRGGDPCYTIADISQDEIIQHVLEEYKAHLSYRSR